MKIQGGTGDSETRKEKYPIRPEGRVLMKRYFMTKPVMITALGNTADETMGNILKGEQKYFSRNRVGALVGRVRLEGDDLFNRILENAAGQLEADARRILEKYDVSRVGVALGGCDYHSQMASPEHKKYLEEGTFGSYNVDLQNPYVPAGKLAGLLGLKGPVFSVAAACASGISTIIRGIDLIESGVADAMLVGGVDLSSDLISAGFMSLSAVSPVPTNPFSLNRSGITLGDGAGLFFVTREQVVPFPVAITGFAESSDGYNMTSPDPEGTAVISIMKEALAMAGKKPEDIGYINLHGTGTDVNDAMESKAVAAVFGSSVKVSSTKAMTGHTLGSAGSIGASICALTLASEPPQMLPPHVNDGVLDPDLAALDFARPGESRNLKAVMNSAFAFGGANAVLLMEKI